MTQKLNFDIEDIQLIDEVNDSQFALVNLDVFASGLNLHGMTTDIETLKRTAKTILLKPLVAKYDRIRDDIGSHDPEQIIIGVVPNDSKITFTELPDGRTMMKTTALIWKNYCHNMIDFFKRDGGKKPLSVEMLVLKTNETIDGVNELLDYCFSAITILGSKITPAIPGAQAEIIRFAVDEKVNFSYEDLDLSIPEKVKQNMQDALDMWSEMEEPDAKTVSLAIARHCLKNSKLTLEKFRQMQRYIPKNFKGDHIDSLLWGGFEGQQYFKDISDKLSELDERKSAYFDIENNKNRVKEDNKYMGKKENKDENFSEDDVEVVEEEMAVEKPVDESVDDKAETPEKVDNSLEMAKPTADEIAKEKAEEDKETPADEKKETPAEKAKEKKDGIEEKFSDNVYLDVAAALAFLKATTESNQEMVDEYGTAIGMAVSEMSKDGEFNFSTIAYGMMKYAEMCNAKMAKMQEDSDVYMSKYSKEKFDEMEKFMTEYNNNQKNFAVDETVKTLLEKFSIPEDSVNEIKKEADQYTFANIDTWKNFAKVKAVDFAVKITSKDEPKENFVRMGFPFTGSNVQVDPNDVWAKKVN